MPSSSKPINKLFKPMMGNENMGRVKKLIKKKREPKTFKGQMRKAVTGDGRRTVKPKKIL